MITRHNSTLVSDREQAHHSIGQIQHCYNCQHVPAPAVTRRVVSCSLAVSSLQAVGNSIKQKRLSVLTIADTTLTQTW